jgi:hypothetical protein
VGQREFAWPRVDWLATHARRFVPQFRKVLGPIPYPLSNSVTRDSMFPELVFCRIKSLLHNRKEATRYQKHPRRNSRWQLFRSINGLFKRRTPRKAIWRALNSRARRPRPGSTSSHSGVRHGRAGAGASGVMK